MLLRALFILLFILSGCNYQIAPVLKGKTVLVAISSETIDTHVLSSSNTFTENIDTLLKAYVVDLSITQNKSNYDTLVNYNQLYADKSKIIDLRLDVYKQIKAVRLDTLSKDERVAFLINAYNFLAIETVLSNYIDDGGEKLKSISDILGKSSFLAFDKILYDVENKKISLNTLEKTLLKSELTNTDGSLDARFHFAVICAAKGCPVLLDEAYDSSKLNDQLNFITKKGLMLSRNFKDLGSVTRLTQIFDWYGEDFKNHKLANGTKAGSVKNFIEEFILGANVTSNIQYVTYDWSLNSL